MNIRVKRLHPDAVIPTYAKPNDSGFDLVVTEDVLIQPGETALVPTGLSFEIPEGYELQIRPRSGVSLRTKLRVANSPGTIDSSHRGEVKVIIDNIEPPIYESNGSYAYTDVVVTMDGRNDDITFAKTHAFMSGTHYIPKGTRIAQGVIAPVIHANLIETNEELTETERGDGGFGSTGVTAEEFADNTRKAFEALPSYIEMEADGEIDDGTRTFQCTSCGHHVTEETGTWAEESNMCAACYCAYQGG